MNLVNLTPHALNIHTPSGMVTLPATGQLARVEMASTPAGEIAGIPVSIQEAGPVEGLPSPKEGVALIVSALVRLAVPGRTDVYSPGPLARDESGQPTGCQGLTANG